MPMPDPSYSIARTPPPQEQPTTPGNASLPMSSWSMATESRPYVSSHASYPSDEQQDDVESMESMQLWLKAWGAKQRAECKQHQDAVVRLLHAMRSEVGEKLSQLERSQQERSERQSKKLATQSLPLSSTWRTRTEAGGKVEEEKELPWTPKTSVEKEKELLWTPATSVGPVSSLRTSICGPCNSQSPSVAVMSVKAAPSTKSGSRDLDLGYASLNEAMANCVGASKSLAVNKTRNSTMGLVRSHLSRSEEEIRPAHSFRKIVFDVVHTDTFQLSMGGLVIAYAGAVGVMADMEMRAALGRHEGPPWRAAIDLVFTLFFALEVLMRFVADGRHYFKGRDRNWNMFDLLVAVLGFIEIGAWFDVRMGFLGVLRTFRALRVLRVIRIFSCIKQLRLMVTSILSSFASLTWAFALLVTVLYIFSVILLQAASDHVMGARELSPEQAREIQEDFGTMYQTLYSLTQAVSGGRSWGEFAEIFIRMNPWYGTLFTLFVVFVVFGVLNILTGVFVEGTCSLASMDRELMITEEMGRHESVVNQMRALFAEMDVDNSGTLSFAELTRNFSDERVKAYFSMLQMDVSEANGLFQLLDKDETGEVSIEEFIMTCMRLKGSARSIDLATMLMESKRLHTALRGFMRAVEENTVETHRQLEVILMNQEALQSHSEGV